MLTLKLNQNWAYVFAAIVFNVLLLSSSSISYADPKVDLQDEYRLQAFDEKQRGNHDLALALYTKAVALGSKDPSVYNDIGVLYEEMGSDNRAESFYLKAIQMQEKYLPAYSNLALFYQRQGKNDLAFNFFKKRYEFSNPSDPWAQKAREEAIKIRPEYRNELVKRDAEVFQAEVVRKNQEEFARQVEIASQHFKRGQEYYSDRKYRDAVLEFNKSLSINPRNQQVLKARKQAILDLSKEDMKVQYQKAMDMMSAGNTLSAKQQVQRMLSTIPNE